MQSSKLDSTEGQRQQSAPFQPWPFSGPACVLTFNPPALPADLRGEACCGSSRCNGQPIG